MNWWLSQLYSRERQIDTNTQPHRNALCKCKKHISGSDCCENFECGECLPDGCENTTRKLQVHKIQRNVILLADQPNPNLIKARQTHKHPNNEPLDVKVFSILTFTNFHLHVMQGNTSHLIDVTLTTRTYCSSEATATFKCYFALSYQSTSNIWRVWFANADSQILLCCCLLHQIANGFMGGDVARSSTELIELTH